MSLVISILFALPLASALSGVVTDGGQVNNQVFDYVIVGGGLGGFTVAGRLSEDPNVSVLVIEAGGDMRNDQDVFQASRYGHAYGRPEMWWNWPTTDGKGMIGGRMLGGSTSINGMTYTRGQKEQYDMLAVLLGGNSNGDRWNWDGMVAAMKKSETFSPPNEEQGKHGANFTADYHGFNGPVHTGFPNQMFGDQMWNFHDVCANTFKIPSSYDPAGGDAAVVSFFPNVSLHTCREILADNLRLWTGGRTTAAHRRLRLTTPPLRTPVATLPF